MDNITDHSWASYKKVLDKKPWSPAPEKKEDEKTEAEMLAKGEAAYKAAMKKLGKGSDNEGGANGADDRAKKAMEGAMGGKNGGGDDRAKAAMEKAMGKSGSSTKS
jgi:hypothetical protein